VRELPAQGGSPEECYFTGPLFDPSRLGQDERKLGSGSQSEYAVGSLHSKHGLVDNLQGTWDSFLPLFGPHSIIHRSLYVTHGGSVACATIMSTSTLSTAQVTFRLIFQISKIKNKITLMELLQVPCGRTRSI